MSTTPLAGRALRRLLSIAVGAALPVAASTALAAPTLSGGIIADLKGLEQQLADDPSAVEDKAESQAQRLSAGNAADRWAAALYLQLAAGAESAQGRHQQAAEHLAAARELDGIEAQQRDRWQRQEAELRIQAGQSSRAAVLLEDWLQRHQDSDALWLMAELAAEQEAWDEAADWVERARQQDADPTAERRQFAGAVMQRSGRLDQALADLEAALADHPANSEGWRRAAAMAQRLGQPQRAAALWESGWRHGALSGSDDLEQRIQLHLAAGTPARAAELLAMAIEQGVLEATESRQRQLAEAWFRARDRQRALAAWQALASDHDRGSDWLRLGQIAAAWGQESVAVGALKRALEKGETDATSWLAALSEETPPAGEGSDMGGTDS